MAIGFGLKWGWYHSIYITALGLGKSMEEVEKMNLGSVLYFLSYQSDTAKMQSQGK